MVDLGTGGTVQRRLYDQTPDSMTAQRIVSETVVALENIHNANIIKGDFGYPDVLIDSEGHILLTDFGFAKRHSGNYSIKSDWPGLANALEYWGMFKGPHSSIQRSLYVFIRNMTDAQLPGKFFSSSGA